MSQPIAAGEARKLALVSLLHGVAEDLQAYEALLVLLEEQFEAALRHRSARLGEVAEALGQAVERIEARRVQRVALVATLLGPGAGMTQVFGLLKGETRHRLEANWSALQEMVIECKRRNVRNSELLTEQYSIMQRVLHGEDQIYAPV